MVLFETALFRKLAQSSLPKVEDISANPIGSPVKNQQPEQTEPENLPVLDVSDLGKYLEDSFDEEEQVPEQVEPEAPPLEEPTEPKEFPTFSNVFDAVNWAEQNNQAMRISYTTKHGRQISRDVEPHGQFHSDSTKHQILVTFDENIGDVRAYILANIRAWAFTGKEFQKRFIVKA